MGKIILERDTIEATMGAVIDTEGREASGRKEA